MEAPAPADDAAKLPQEPSYRRFDSEADYRAALLHVTALAKREIRILDRTLQTMALHRPDAAGLLHEFLRSNRNACLLVAIHDGDFIATGAPRLWTLLDTHAGAVQFRLVPDDLRQLPDAHLLADGRHGVRRFHHDFPRGSQLLDNPQEVAPWWHRFDELWELCTPLTLGTVTGL